METRTVSPLRRTPDSPTGLWRPLEEAPCRLPSGWAIGRSDKAQLRVRPPETRSGALSPPPAAVSADGAVLISASPRSQAEPETVSSPEEATAPTGKLPPAPPGDEGEDSPVAVGERPAGPAVHKGSPAPHHTQGSGAAVNSRNQRAVETDEANSPHSAESSTLDHSLPASTSQTHGIERVSATQSTADFQRSPCEFSGRHSASLPARASRTGHNRRPPPSAATEASMAKLPDENVPGGSAQQLHLQLGEGSESRVNLSVLERGGHIHVSVRTPNPEISVELRRDLQELVQRLEQSGQAPETWTPNSATATPRSKDVNEGMPGLDEVMDNRRRPDAGRMAPGNRDRTGAGRAGWMFSKICTVRSSGRTAEQERMR